MAQHCRRHSVLWIKPSFEYRSPAMNANITPVKFFLVLLTLLIALPVHASLQKQRDSYAAALIALEEGDTAQFEQLKRKLRDYPLYPYLEYKALSADFDQVSHRQVESFLKTYKSLPISNILRSQYLYQLQQRGDWKNYRRFYKPGSASSSQQCHYQYARYLKGEQTAALQEAVKLWNVGQSQPNACDKLFEILISKGMITEKLAWSRYKKAVLGHKFRLARYLKRFFTSDHYIQLAENFYAMDRNQDFLAQRETIGSDSPEVRAVIRHGIEHLARQDAIAAMEHWNYYQKKYNFDASSRSRVVDRLIKRLYQQDHKQLADRYLRDNADLTSSSLVEWRAREALAELQWSDLLDWIDFMPQELQQTQRWRYWRSRAEEQIAGKKLTKTRKTYRQLAQNRSLYGFLAGDKLGLPYNMAHREAIPNNQRRKEMEREPGVLRTRELLYHNDYRNARREWRRVSRNFTETDWVTAAHLTRDWNWHNGSINSMIRASFWDDTRLRFPIPYRQTFAKHADETDIPVYLLLALARQESAMSHDVTSSAGAKGLMQLMPATARQTAKKNGIPYRNSNDLFSPETNITLGSRYYREMLDRFDNNRILATAAYNAGPHRVNRWLERSRGQLPFDIWIEIIPFPETRGYVQNVLAFSMIYANHLDMEEAPMLRPDERERLL